MPPIVITHSNCLDGLAARWVIDRALNGVCEHHPGVYGQPPPDVNGREVILADFTYKRPVLEAMLQDCESMLILDHHDSAFRDLDGLTDKHDNLKVVFDMKRSGAGIAWDFLMPVRRRPRLIDLVEDNDLWRFNYPETRAVVEQVRGHAETIETFQRFVDLCEDPMLFSTVVFLGQALLGYKSQMVQHACRMAQKVIFEGHVVWATNVPYFLSSETANALIHHEGDHPLGITWYIADDGRIKVSLRSDRDDVNVARMAEKYGGGGHPRASGFVCEEPPWMKN